MTTPYIPIAGTWHKDHGHPGSWYRRGSSVDAIFRLAGFERVEQDRDPNTPDRGFWSGDLGGTLIQRALPWVDARAPWASGAIELGSFIERRADELRDGVLIVGHSHGGQVVTLTLADPMFAERCGNVPIHVLTIDMPVRRAMRGVYRRAARRVASWTHLYAGWGWPSRMRVLGSVFGPRRLALPGVGNVHIRGGHSGILVDTEHRQQLPDILRRVHTHGPGAVRWRGMSEAL